MPRRLGATRNTRMLLLIGAFWSTNASHATPSSLSKLAATQLSCQIAASSAITGTAQLFMVPTLLTVPMLSASGRT
ncbi:hypothetical protein CFIMG_002007RA [Ceratocystis fimbriata CBS 114723]|uniref:Uncharacterized protein n=1 Tax=Ceratocystis fimbriata CBS 114723 TaxID=1035309 RepID=A0A2C5WWX2_9PEZI|nr:hypothetical protein CFIMG_002007RA [Ceratocystis fimbriata CBS 114723]